LIRVLKRFEEKLSSICKAVQAKGKGTGTYSLNQREKKRTGTFHSTKKLDTGTLPAAVQQNCTDTDNVNMLTVSKLPVHNGRVPNRAKWN
jgi:hypothetical protein